MGGKTTMLLENSIYSRQIGGAVREIGNSVDSLAGCSILITGASGMIGSCIVDLLLYLNKQYDMGIKIYAAGRNGRKIEQRFNCSGEKSCFHILEWDVTEKLEPALPVDYIIHAASNADPFMFAECPVDTLLANVMGVKNLLDLALKQQIKRMLYVSSGEMYGQPDNTVKDGFTENYSGFVDYRDFRSCYPSGKRAAEVLCQSYIQQYGVDGVIVRPCHCYGPTLTKTDSRALSQFLRQAQEGKDIVLKSSGETIRSHCYVVDAAAGILKVLLEGECGEAYNIADPDSVASIKEIAELIAREAGQKVSYDIPGKIEQRGYSKVNRSVLDSSKIYLLGWRPQTDLHMGVHDTLRIMKSLGKSN